MFHEPPSPTERAAEGGGRFTSAGDERRPCDDREAVYEHCGHLLPRRLAAEAEAAAAEAMRELRLHDAPPPLREPTTGLDKRGIATDASIAALRERHLVKASPRTGGRSGRRKHKRGWWEAGHARPSTLHEGWYWTQPTPAMPWARVTV